MFSQRLTLVTTLAMLASAGCAGESETDPADKDLHTHGKADCWCDDDDSDTCEAHGWYDDDVCDTFCPKPDPDCDGDSDEADDDEPWSGGTPTVYRAYVEDGQCFGGETYSPVWSLVVEGSSFVNTGVSEHGHQIGSRWRLGEQWPQPHWNQLSTTRGCITVGSVGYYAGKPLSVLNPNDSESNSVIVEDRSSL